MRAIPRELQDMRRRNGDAPGIGLTADGLVIICELPEDYEDGTYAIQYAHACGYAD